MEAKITAVILTKNEEKNIVDCIESVKFCDEILIIDDHSEDRTLELIKSLKERKITVYEHALSDDFSKQRNFGLQKATGDWVFFLDSDERLSPMSETEIVQMVNNPTVSFSGYYLKRIDTMWRKKILHGETGNIQLLRLAKKGSGQWEGKVHEKWVIKGRIGSLQHPIQHYPHQTLTEFLEEINFYTTLRAGELFEKKVRTSFLSIILYTKVKFFMNFFVKQGYKDGIRGFIFAMLMSLHSFLVRGKLWLLWRGQKTQ